MANEEWPFATNYGTALVALIGAGWGLVTVFLRTQRLGRLWFRQPEPKELAKLLQYQLQQG